MRSVFRFIAVLIPSIIVTWYTIFGIFGSEVSVREFLVQTMGGGIGAYRAAILVTGVILFFLLVGIGWKAVTGEPKRIKLHIFYIASVLGFLSFAILGGEFSAPKSTFASWLNLNSSFSSARVISRSDVEFELKSCESMGNKITCNFGLYNLGPDEVIDNGYLSYIVDNDNNTVRVSLFSVGNQNYGNLPHYKYYINLPEGAEAELNMSFESNSFDNAKLVRALYIKLHMGGKKESMVFRNISL